MRRRGRVERVAKWLLTGALCFSIAWIVLGVFWSVEYVRDRGPTVDIVRIGSGGLLFNAEDKAAAWRNFALVLPAGGFHVHRRIAGWPSLSLEPWGGWFESRDACYLWVNVRPFMLLMLLPTLLLWLRVNRQADCDCEFCGYDLTGNTSGVCPECGRPVSVVALESAGAANQGAAVE